MITSIGSTRIKQLAALIFAVIVMTSAAFAHNKPKVAVYVTDGGSQNTSAKILAGAGAHAIVGDALVKAINLTGEGSAVNLTKDITEKFGASADAEQAAAIGRKFKVQNLCVVTIRGIGNTSFSLSVAMIDVSTGNVTARGGPTPIDLANPPGIPAAMTNIAVGLVSGLAVKAVVKTAAGPPPQPASALQPVAGKEIRVHFIDLGQADGILIQSAQNAVLIDGGERKTQNALVKYLRSAGVTTLDYVVATHPHSDHIGGLAKVIRQFDVKNVLMPDAIHTSGTFEKLLDAIEKKGLKVTVPSVGDEITAGIIKFTVLAPGKEFKDLNDMSIVLRMAHGKTAFLFAGDAEVSSEQEMLNTGLTLKADVLKSGHHGSRTSTTAGFLNAVRPNIVVVTCGKENSYKHPHREFLELVNQPKRKITLLRTDELGTVIVTTDKKKIKVYNHK